MGMKRSEHGRKEVYPITQMSFLTDDQKLNFHNIIPERYSAIILVMNSNYNRGYYGHYKEGCNISYNSQGNHKWTTNLTETYGKLKNYKFKLDYCKTPNSVSQTCTELLKMQHSFLQESDTADDMDTTDDGHSTQGHEEGISHVQIYVETTRNTETNSSGRNIITCYKLGSEGNIAPKCTHTTDGWNTHQIQ